MPVITDRPDVGGEEPDGPFATRLVAGETRIPAPQHWHVLRPRGMAGWILHLTVAGEGRVRVGDIDLPALPGTALLFAPQAVHDYDRADHAALWHHRWVYFHPRPHWMPWLEALGENRAGVSRLTVRRPAVDRGLAEVARLAGGGGAWREERAMHRLEGVLLDLLATAPPRPGAQQERVRHACAWMTERLDRNLPVSAVAAAVGLSASRLGHLFQRQFGCGVLRWRDLERVRRARDLLATTGMPIVAVAARVGYQDPQYFGRVFRRLAGVAPGRYRRGATARKDDDHDR